LPADRFLLDTCAVIYWQMAPSRLGSRSTALLQTAEAQVFLSPVSIWEIGLKSSIGKLQLPQALPTFLQSLLPEVSELAFDWQCSIRSESLPHHHRDPFDRMLIAQALEHDLTIITNNSALESYGVATTW